MDPKVWLCWRRYKRIALSHKPYSEDNLLQANSYAISLIVHSEVLSITSYETLQIFRNNLALAHETHQMQIVVDQIMSN